MKITLNHFLEFYTCAFECKLLINLFSILMCAEGENPNSLFPIRTTQLQVPKLVCHGFKDIDRRHRITGLVSNDTYVITTQADRILWLLCRSSKLQFLQGGSNSEAQVTHTHSGLCNWSWSWRLRNMNILYWAEGLSKLFLIDSCWYVE